MRAAIAHSLVLLVLVTSLGAAKPEAPPPKAAVKSRPHSRTKRSHKPYQVGRASWYGKHFHGKKTASGTPYDMFQFTAAHRALPLGTMVKVTNLRNSRWVVVRINDRGPVPQSRIIDVSYGAAQILGFRAHGVERVRLDIVEPTQMAEAQPQPEVGSD